MGVIGQVEFPRCARTVAWLEEKKTAPEQGPEAVSGRSCVWSVGVAAAPELAAQVEFAGNVTGVDSVGLGGLPDGERAGDGRLPEERGGQVHRAAEVGIRDNRFRGHTVLPGSVC